MRERAGGLAPATPKISLVMATRDGLAPWKTTGQILKEAARLLKPGGRVGLLHFLVPLVRKPLRLVGVWGITTGAGYAIRAWTVLEKVPR